MGALVDLDDLTDDHLILIDVIADILDPSGGDLTDVDQPAFVLVLFEVDENPEVLDFVDATDDEFGGGGPAAVFHTCR